MHADLRGLLPFSLVARRCDLVATAQQVSQASTMRAHRRSGAGPRLKDSSIHGVHSAPCHAADAACARTEEVTCTLSCAAQGVCAGCCLGLLGMAQGWRARSAAGEPPGQASPTKVDQSASLGATVEERATDGVHPAAVGDAVPLQGYSNVGAVQQRMGRASRARVNSHVYLATQALHRGGVTHSNKPAARTKGSRQGLRGGRGGGV